MTNDEYDIEKIYGFYQDNEYHALVKLKDDERPLRGRSEMIVIKNNKIFLCFRHSGTYSLPGGSWCENEDHLEAARRETREEISIDTINVVYGGHYIVTNINPLDWVKEKIPESYWWYGMYTKIYIGEYNGKCINDIPVENQNSIGIYGKFYEIHSVWDKLKPEHREALANYYNLNESTLSTEERNNIKKSDFGLPRQRKFPLNDKAHVLAAIRFFRFAKKDERRELALNIGKAIKKFNMDVEINKDSLLYRYMNLEYTTENVIYLTHNNDEDEYLNYDTMSATVNDEYRDLFASSHSDNNEKEYGMFLSAVYKNHIKLDHMLHNKIGYDAYDNQIEVNKFIIALYKDIFEKLYAMMTNKCSDNDKLIMMNIIEKLNNPLLDHNDYFLRSVYRICIINKYTKSASIFASEIYNTLEKSYMYKHTRNFEAYDFFSDILDMMTKLKCHMFNLMKYLEQDTKNNFQIYINDTGEMDECGYLIEKPKLESIQNVDMDIDQYLSEGLSIDENGTIKITINPKETYMDKYSACHKILHENYKNKNYEGMKDNLAFMFYLITSIERHKDYKSRKDSDLIKARAFATNDFKTYLGYLQKAEPSFNFIQYYKQSEIGKYTILIPKETIIGIKTIFQAIIK